MIILQLTGGLGNQMFQYAFGRSTALRLGVGLRIDITNHTLQIHNGVELGRVFGIPVQIATTADVRSVLGWQYSRFTRGLLRRAGAGALICKSYIAEQGFGFKPEFLQVSDNVFLSGYWQSEKYFHNVADTIRSDFRFCLLPSEPNVALAAAINMPGVDSVSLHIRRGDYVHNAAVNAIHGSCSLAYYQDAMALVAGRVKNPHFYVFSDDVNWVAGNLPMPYPHTLVDHNRGSSSYEDMRLMSTCRHHVIANSSFSWWGAWLNDKAGKIVVAPKRWFSNADVVDVLPEGWIRL